MPHTNNEKKKKFPIYSTSLVTTQSNDQCTLSANSRVTYQATVVQIGEGRSSGGWYAPHLSLDLTMRYCNIMIKYALLHCYWHATTEEFLPATLLMRSRYRYDFNRKQKVGVIQNFYTIMLSTPQPSTSSYCTILIYVVIVYCTCITYHKLIHGFLFNNSLGNEFVYNHTIYFIAGNFTDYSGLVTD